MEAESSRIEDLLADLDHWSISDDSGVHAFGLKSTLTNSPSLSLAATAAAKIYRFHLVLLKYKYLTAVKKSIKIRILAGK
ncbi:MAG: hypothetical protein H6661_06455 [Ardenticatenaceae bacterium]|nr:hypothetical protein [Ardenticatenaceae bacterium]